MTPHAPSLSGASLADAGNGVGPFIPMPSVATGQGVDASSNATIRVEQLPVHPHHNIRNDSAHTARLVCVGIGGGIALPFLFLPFHRSVYGD